MENVTIGRKERIRETINSSKGNYIKEMVTTSLAKAGSRTKYSFLADFDKLITQGFFIEGDYTEVDKYLVELGILPKKFLNRKKKVITKNLNDLQASIDKDFDKMQSEFDKMQEELEEFKRAKAFFVKRGIIK